MRNWIRSGSPKSKIAVYVVCMLVSGLAFLRAADILDNMGDREDQGLQPVHIPDVRASSIAHRCREPGFIRVLCMLQKSGNLFTCCNMT